MNQPNVPLEKCYRLLKQVDIFHHVPSAVLEDLAKKMILASYAQDSLIILKGEPGNSMYLVIEGKVKIHDEEHNVAEMGTGMLFDYSRHHSPDRLLPGCERPSGYDEGYREGLVEQVKESEFDTHSAASFTTPGIGEAR